MNENIKWELLLCNNSICIINSKLWIKVKLIESKQRFICISLLVYIVAIIYAIFGIVVIVLWMLGFECKSAFIWDEAWALEHYWDRLIVRLRLCIYSVDKH